jgi:hypothetical protein
METIDSTVYTPTELMADNLSHGVTIMFVSTQGDQIRAEAMAAKLGLTCCSTRWMGQHSAHESFSCLKSTEHPDRLLLAKTPELSHGFRLEADRVIWVGDVGEPMSAQRAVFTQSMGRGKNRHTYSKMARAFAFTEVPSDD